MATTKPVKVLTDLVTKKQIIKQDEHDNVLFRVTGSHEGGFISSSLPFTGSNIVVGGKIYPGINSLADVSASSATNGQFLTLRDGIWQPKTLTSEDFSLQTSGNVTGSGDPANPVTLKENIEVNQVTASYIRIAGPIVNNPDSAIPFSSTTVLPGESKNIDEFLQSYNAAKYLILAKSANHAQMAEAIVTKNSTSAIVTPYAISYTSANPLASFTVQKNDINGTIELIITNMHVSTITVTMQRSYLI